MGRAFLPALIDPDGHELSFARSFAIFGVTPTRSGIVYLNSTRCAGRFSRLSGTGILPARVLMRPPTRRFYAADRCEFQARADSDELSTGRHTLFARFTPNLGRHLTSAEGGRWRSLLFARVVIIGRKKPKRVVNEHLLISYAPLRHFHYALGNHFPHHARVRWPRESTARFLKSPFYCRYRGHGHKDRSRGRLGRTRSGLAIPPRLSSNRVIGKK